MKRLLFVAIVSCVLVSSGFAGTFQFFVSQDDWVSHLPDCAGIGPTCTYYFTEDFNDPAMLPMIQVNNSAGASGAISGGLWTGALSSADYTTWILDHNYPHLTITAWGATFALTGCEGTCSGLQASFYMGSNPVSFDLPLPAIASNGFWGIVSDTQFNTVVISGVGTGTQQYTMDDMVFNPEPATCLLLGFGLLGLGFASRRIHKKG